MKYLKSILITAMAVIATSLNADPTFYLKIEEISSSETDCILEISVAGSEAMALGSSNLQFLYDDANLANPALVSTTLGQNYNVSITHPTSTKASFNIELFSPSSGMDVAPYPVWTVLGQVHFDVLNSASSEEISWSYTGTTTETVVFIDDESTQIFVGDPNSDLVGVLHGTITPVTIPEITDNKEIFVFPNPFIDHIRVERASPIESAGQVTLTDVGGKILRTWVFPENAIKFTLDQLGGLPSGTYFIQFGLKSAPVTRKVLKF